MGYRLTRIYTRTGDDGTTGLSDGSRIAKDDPRLQAIGDVDELNCALGMLLAHPLPDAVRNCLVCVQHLLFDIGAELSLPQRQAVNDAMVAGLEALLDDFNAGLPPLKEFILPGGNPAAAVCHLARAVCRRAERRLVGLDRREKLNPHTLAYVNRLSDLLFVIARLLTQTAGAAETQWQSVKHP